MTSRPQRKSVLRVWPVLVGLVSVFLLLPPIQNGAQEPSDQSGDVQQGKNNEQPSGLIRTLGTTRANDSTSEESGHRLTVNTVSFSRDGSRIATAGDDHTIRIWDTDTGTQIKTISVGHTDLFSVEYFPNQKRLIAAGDDKALRFWDVRKEARLALRKEHNSHLHFADLSRDGRRVVTSSSDETLILWDAREMEPIRSFNVDLNIVNEAAISPNGRFIAYASNNDVIIRDVQSGEKRRVLKGHRKSVEPVKYSPGGRFLATGSKDGTARVWDTKRGTLLLTLDDHTKRVESVDFSPSGLFLVTGSIDGVVRIWDLASGTMFRSYPMDSGIVGVRFSPDGSYVAAGYRDSTVRFWRVSSPSNTSAYNNEQSGQESNYIWTALRKSSSETYVSLLHQPREQLQKRMSQIASGLQSLFEKRPSNFEKYLQDLTSPEYRTREQAQRYLEQHAGLPQVQHVLNRKLQRTHNPEQKARLRQIQSSWRQLPVRGQQLQLVRSIPLLKKINTPRSRSLLTRIKRRTRPGIAAALAQSVLRRLASGKTRKQAQNTNSE